MSDHDLEALLRASSPYPSGLDRNLSLRAEADLERISRDGGGSSGAPRWGWRVSVPAVAVTVIVIVLAFVLNPIAAPVPAAAGGLAPLSYHPSALSKDEAIDLAQSLLAESPGVAGPIREAVTVAWYAHVAMDGPDQGTVISPEVMTWTWDAVAKTSRVVVIAGEPYRVDGMPVSTRNDLPIPGTVLRDDSMGAESLTAQGPDGVHPLPTTLEGGSVEFYEDAIHRLNGVAPTGFDVLTGIPQFLTMWTLTNEQHANMIELLRRQNDVDFLGTTQDRAGRDVLAFAAHNTVGLHQNVLLVSADTGRVIGSETTYLGDDPDVPIPTGSVMSYELWEATPLHH